SITLPYFVDYHTKGAVENCNDSRGIEHVNHILSIIRETIPSGEHLQRFITDIGLGIDYLDLSKEDLTAIVNNINEERVANNPFKINKEELLTYLNRLIR